MTIEELRSSIEDLLKQYESQDGNPLVGDCRMSVDRQKFSWNGQTLKLIASYS